MPDLAGCDRVCSDNAQGAKLVADLFSRRGWRQVGFIGETRENFSTRQRYEAFIARTSDMAVSSRFCDGGGYQAGYQAARELVAENPGMQALFCATDMLALGAQDGLRDAAAPLPAIVGFDDIRAGGLAALSAHHRSAEYRPAGPPRGGFVNDADRPLQPALAPSRSAGETNYSS